MGRIRLASGLRYADRLEIVHVLSRESGRIDREKLEGWLRGLVAPHDVDEWFLCGPIELVCQSHPMSPEVTVDYDV